MATIICMDGLGGHPQTTFGGLKTVLEQRRHRVILADIKNIQSHEDRIDRVLACYRKERKSRPFEKIVLVGQSAGGSAVRIAAERLSREIRDSREEQLGGVILMSPAMPSFILFLTLVLFKTIGRRIFDLLFGRIIATTEAEFEALVAPLPPETHMEVIARRTDISGTEGRRLAFYPNRFRGYRFPTLHMYGDKDQWIAPSAQQKLGEMISRAGSPLTTYVIEGSGHITLASDKRDQVIDFTVDWIETL